jgi:raffinose/stachyose/melibiose transport system permease protein
MTTVPIAQRVGLRRKRGEPASFPRYLILVVLALFVLAPLVTLVFNAFKSNAAIGSNPLAPPTSFTFHNFVQAWQDGNFAVTMRNSVIICAGSMAGVCVISGMAAFAMSHLELPGRGAVANYLFIVSAMPAQLFLVPLFFMWTSLHLVDNLFGLIVIYWATDAPFATLLLRSFLTKIPKDFVEAARLDGANTFQTLTRVVLPLAWPGFLTVALISGLWAWNEFFWAVTFIHDPNLRPISTSFLAFEDESSTNWALASAAALFMVVPVLLLFLLLQRRFVNGLTAGGLR